MWMKKITKKRNHPFCQEYGLELLEERNLYKLNQLRLKLQEKRIYLLLIVLIKCSINEPFTAMGAEDVT